MAEMSFQPLHDPDRSYLPGITPLVHHATSSLRRISGTFMGISDTSSSESKQALLLRGEELAERIDDNFQRAIYYLLHVFDKVPPKSPLEVRELLTDTYQIVNDGLLSEPFIWRSWETRYHIPAASIDTELDRFCAQCYAHMTNPQKDVISYSAWCEKELNTRIHPFYDGCGRVSRAWSISALARENCKWPVFDSREEYFSLIERPLDVWISAYRDRINSIDYASLENHQTFLDRLCRLGHSPELIELEDEAYSISKHSLRGQFRRSEVSASGLQIRSFEHSRSAALILMDEGGAALEALPDYVQATLIIGCLHHDLVEDTTIYGSPRLVLPGFESSWRDIAAVRIRRFDPAQIYPTLREASYALTDSLQLSSIVLAVTCPSDEELSEAGIQRGDPLYAKKKMQLTIEYLRRGGPAAIVLKLCDRIANLRTMENTETCKVIEKIRETQDCLLPLFREFSDESKGHVFTPLIKCLIERLENDLAVLRTRPDVAVEND